VKRSSGTNRGSPVSSSAFIWNPPWNGYLHG